MYRLTKIDELLLPSYQYLDDDDECFFFMTYTRLNQGYTKENDLILNFKKKVDRRGKPEWKYKLAAIDSVAKLFIENIPPIGKPNVLFIPIPPSRCKEDKMYDDRVVKVLDKFCEARPNTEYREILSITENMTPTHESKMSPKDLMKYIRVDKQLCDPPKKYIYLVDDVITDGSHFKACKNILQSAFPKATIKGLFIARTLH
jgi:predicted amidophosphoribosyltransferase